VSQVEEEVRAGEEDALVDGRRASDAQDEGELVVVCRLTRQELRPKRKKESGTHSRDRGREACC